MGSNQDEFWMGEALNLAREASMMGEVPVGALVVFQGQIVGRGLNSRETAKTPLGHAEIMAIERASKVLGRWRLWGATLYVTLEPCPMCAGAIVHARLPRVVFGASDPRTGACGSVFNLVQHEALNHRVDLTSGVLGEECSRLIKDFSRSFDDDDPAISRLAHLVPKTYKARPVGVMAEPGCRCLMRNQVLIQGYWGLEAHSLRQK